MTFGQSTLLQGFDFLIAVIGLFGLGEILLTMEEGLAFKGTRGKINVDECHSMATGKFLSFRRRENFVRAKQLSGLKRHWHGNLHQIRMQSRI